MKKDQIESIAQYMRSWETEELEDAFIAFCVDTLETEGRVSGSICEVVAAVDQSWFSTFEKRCIYLVLKKTVLDGSGNTLVMPGSIALRTEAALSFKNISFNPGSIEDLIASARASSSLFLGSYSSQLLLESIIPLWRLKLTRSKLRKSVDSLSELLDGNPTPDLFTERIPSLLEAQQSIWSSASTDTVKSAGWKDSIEELLEPLPKSNSISTGIHVLDETIQGGIAGPGSAYAGRLIVIAARPGMGKTTFAITLATHLASSDYDVAFFSLEMPRKQIEYKSIACKDFLDKKKVGKIIDPIRVYDLQKRTYNQNQRERIAALIDNSFVKRFGIFDTSETSRSIASKIKMLSKTRPNLRGIFIDYLQLIDDCRGEGSTSEVSAIGAVTQSLKRVAVESGIDIFLLSQVNRGVEHRTEKMPGLADLRASGRIEEDSDVVMFLYRPGYYDPNHDQYELAISVAKNRGGITGILPCRVDLTSSVIFDRL